MHYVYGLLQNIILLYLYLTSYSMISKTFTKTCIDRSIVVRSFVREVMATTTITTTKGIPSNTVVWCVVWCIACTVHIYFSVLKRTSTIHFVHEQQNISPGDVRVRSWIWFDLSLNWFEFEFVLLFVYSILLHFGSSSISSSSSSINSIRRSCCCCCCCWFF